MSIEKAIHIDTLVSPKEFESDLRRQAQEVAKREVAHRVVQRATTGNQLAKVFKRFRKTQQ